jgi:hypothetical protein
MIGIIGAIFAAGAITATFLIKWAIHYVPPGAHGPNKNAGGARLDNPPQEIDISRHTTGFREQTQAVKRGEPPE